MLFIEESLRALPHNPHYLNRYFRLIEKWNGQGTIKHHILPSKLFTEHRNLSQNPWNNARLTHRQHFIIHWVLWKALPESAEMRCAFWAMKNKDDQKLDSRTYEVLRKELRSTISKINKEMVVAKNQDGEFVQVSKRDFKKTKLKGSQFGTVAVIDAHGNRSRVSKEEFEIRDDLRGVASGKNRSNKSEATKKLMGKSMSSLPRVCCVRCQQEFAGHHLNRHLNGNGCI